MAAGYFENGKQHEIGYFDLFFRSIPDGGGYAVAAGQQVIIDYLENLKFTPEDITFLRQKNLFSEAFLNYLLHFKFQGDVWMVPEGSVVFPNEPLIIVRANIIEAQLIETYLLLQMNHQSLIATKSARIVRSAQGRPVMEFGARRAHGADAALYGAKAAYVGGVFGTSLAKAEQHYHIPALGTMAHSWVQMFDTELEAFIAYAKTYPHTSTFLVDTYNVLKSGVPNAIKAIKAVLWPKGIKNAMIRIDSGDLTYLSKEARKMLDEAGMKDVKIVVSNSLDEWIISELLAQGAAIDFFGVGERLITAKSEPVFGGVYKLVATEKNGNIIPKIKLSENPEKMTNPAFKQVWRLYDRTTHKALADLITLHHEIIRDQEPLEIFDPLLPHKRKILTNFIAKKRLVLVFAKGVKIVQDATLFEAREHLQNELESLWDEVKRFVNPHKYYVDLSEKLWTLRNDMIHSQLAKEGSL
jgi:nicotinate phosphoribosyltransferase